MEFRIFGPTSMVSEGRTVACGTVKVRGLLGVLLMKANKLVDADLLAEALWDDDKRPPSPRSTLQVYVSRLRGVLSRAGKPATVITEDEGYRLEVDASKVDYHQFLDHMRLGHGASGRGDHALAVAHFEAALQVWQRPPLSVLTTSWARHQRETLTARELLPTYSALFEAKLELGEHEYVLTELHRLLADHGHDEMLARQWMRVLAVTHRSAEIHSFYKDFHRRLVAELGVPPSEGTADLYRNLTTRRNSPGSPVPVPAARGAGAPDLPPAPRFFTGRQDLLSRLDRLTGSSVVVVDGPPGVGKTALVTHWARTRCARYPDGILYANLRGYDREAPAEPSIVMSTFLSALGAPIPDSVDERVAALRHVLTDRKILVILDNAHNASHVRSLLPGLSPCPVVITSRQQLTSLSFHGEAERISVPPLPEADAETLLHSRIGPCPPHALTQLVALCDRIPLALLIVSVHIAARPSLPIDEIIEDLRQTPRLLDAGQLGDDMAPSLRSVFSWSYRDLPPPAARLFRSLGSHPTPRFSSHAAETVSGLSRQATLHALDTLIGAHLVQQEHTDEYSMHDIAHTFAAEAADDPAAVHRLASWYLLTLGNARELLIPDDHPVAMLPPEDGVQPLTFETTEQALQWCMTERSTLIAMIRALANSGLPKADQYVWRFAGCLGELLDRYGDIHEQIEVHTLGYQAADRVGDRTALAGCLNNLGKAFILLHHYEPAQRIFELARPIFEEIGDRFGAAVCTHNLGTIYLERGKAREAIRIYEQALGEIVRYGTEWAEAHTLHRLGECHRRLDNVREADKCYQLALALRTKIGDVRQRGVTLAALGQLHLEQGNRSAAIDFCQASVDIHIQTADRGSMAATLCTLATALIPGSPRQAINHASRAVATYKPLGDPHGEAQALAILATAYERTGELENARDTWAQAHTLLDTLEDPRASDVERRVRDLRRATSGIPDPRPDQTRPPTTQENQ